ncbi:hypothetical protein BA059_03275 [Mycolicibacterium sp. (ex Dasyatis americana)]|uniref:Uncharacterized protein n=1 Tax=Mycolicibacterium fortuitum TaxID=1766 RepID=A0A0N9YA99_MYCFO|nr:hypothetical protein [Mycolicibacterium fortuitum]ALI26563.1 hypothetical protein XA26_27230 [Mycolicibacterium fortuitum]OFB43695.1 hypothetical protein BA059_03275 [Mycolicibacterium sp. (ex Dasyatis americana)]
MSKTGRHPIINYGHQPEHWTSIPYELSKLDAKDGMTADAAALMVKLYRHANNWEVSAALLAGQLGWCRKRVEGALDVLVALGWLVIQRYVFSDGRRNNARRYHLQRERRFTDDEIDVLSQPIVVGSRGSREHVASESLALRHTGGVATRDCKGVATSGYKGVVTAGDNKLDEALDQDTRQGASHPRGAREQADELIGQCIPDTGVYETPTLRALGAIIANLLSQPTVPRDAVELALYRWHQRPELEPPAMHFLVSDVLNEFPYLTQSPEVPDSQGVTS